MYTKQYIHKNDLRTVKWAQWDKTQSRELLGLFICVCIALCTIVAHNIAQNRPDNFPSYPTDNRHCSDDVYLMEGGCCGYLSAARRKWFAYSPPGATATPSIISCFIKIQTGLSFLVPALLRLSGRGCLNGCLLADIINMVTRHYEISRHLSDSLQHSYPCCSCSCHA